MKEAKAALLVLLNINKSAEIASITDKTRKDQVGSGMRGDKIRTIRFQDDRINDHRTGRSTTAKRFMKGFISDLWE